MKHILTAKQFTVPEINHLMDQANWLRHHGRVAKRHEGVLATLFYEPSTRTRLSFEAAMHRIGGSVISVENANNSSATKGESIEDTVRIVGQYADVIVLRHPEVGIAARAAAVSPVPIINAGDGTGEHPTQALLDIYTVKSHHGRVSGLRYCLVGDMKHGRTIHSLIYLLGLYQDIHITLVTNGKLALPDEVLNFITTKAKISQTESLEQAIREQPDVVYMTRFQRERCQAGNNIQYDFRLTESLMDQLKREAVILHPLPRQQEIPSCLDTDPRCVYFRQAKNGMWMRAALLVEAL